MDARYVRMRGWVLRLLVYVGQREWAKPLLQAWHVEAGLTVEEADKEIELQRQRMRSSILYVALALSVFGFLVQALTEKGLLNLLATGVLFAGLVLGASQFQGRSKTEMSLQRLKELLKK